MSVRKQLYLTLSLTSMFAVILAMCARCVTRPNPESVALQFAESLPLPSDTSLIATTSGVDQGSQDECYAGYTEQLYGTNIPIEEIVSFYHEYATHDGWTVNSDYSNDIRLSATKQGLERYLFGVHPLAPRRSATELYPTRLHPEVVDEAFRKFTAVYIISTAYVQLEAVIGCTP